jgi:DNA replication protein DnaC
LKTSPKARGETNEVLPLLLRELKLPSFAAEHARAAERALADGWEYQAYLRHLTEVEIEDRRQRRVERLRKESLLPPAKTAATLEKSKLPSKVVKLLPSLEAGEFIDRAENVLVFGTPGTGKSHLVCAIGHALIDRGRSVLFTATFKLVQDLLAAKRDLAIDKLLKKLDRFDAVILDDIGYVQQSREEMEVLFTFLAERYERRPVLITSNLVFSQWDQIFKDAMTTAAAIDRVVHHSVILELSGPSYRAGAASARQKAQAAVIAKSGADG